MSLVLICGERDKNTSEDKMSRLHAVNPKEATGRAKELIVMIEENLGMIPNLYRVLANAPGVLEAYMGMKTMLEDGALPRKLQEQIALTVSEVTGCTSCTASHTAIGRTVGLSEQEISDSRHGVSPDRRIEDVLQFARKVVLSQGRVSEEDIDILRERNFHDGEIVEVIAQVLVILFTNIFNNAAGTMADFPASITISERSNDGK